MATPNSLEFSRFLEGVEPRKQVKSKQSLPLLGFLFVADSCLLFSWKWIEHQMHCYTTQTWNEIPFRSSPEWWCLRCLSHHGSYLSLLLFSPIARRDGASPVYYNTARHSGIPGTLGRFLSILKMSTRESQIAQGESWRIPGGQALVEPLLAEAGKFSPVADRVMLVLAPTKEIGDDSAQQRGPLAVLCQEVPHIYLPQPLHLARTDHVMGCQEATFWTPSDILSAVGSLAQGDSQRNNNLSFKEQSIPCLIFDRRKR